MQWKESCVWLGKIRSPREERWGPIWGPQSCSNFDIVHLSVQLLGWTQVLHWTVSAWRVGLSNLAYFYMWEPSKRLGCCRPTMTTHVLSEPACSSSPYLSLRSALNMSSWPVLLSRIPASSPYGSTGIETHRDLTWPCPAWCGKWGGALLIDLLIAGWESVSSLSGRWLTSPSSWNPFICTRRFFSWGPQMLEEGRVWCRTVLAKPAPRVLWKEHRGPLPSLRPSGAGSEDLTVICLSGGFVPFKGELGGTYVDLMDLGKAGTCQLCTAPAEWSFGTVLQGAVS